MATILLSTGATLSSTLKEKTTRQVFKRNLATITVTGVSGYDTVQLLNPTIDAQFQAATPSAPIDLGVDDILFRVLYYPEAF